MAVLWLSLGNFVAFAVAIMTMAGFGPIAQHVGMLVQVPLQGYFQFFQLLDLSVSG